MYHNIANDPMENGIVVVTSTNLIRTKVENITHELDIFKREKNLKIFYKPIQQCCSQDLRAFNRSQLLFCFDYGEKDVNVHDQNFALTLNQIVQSNIEQL